MTEIYTDTAHNITYTLDENHEAEMTCRTCDRTFIADPSDTESENAPYDASGDPACDEHAN